MLEIRVNMNSSVEDVLAFKTCCNLKLSDQNLEILVKNQGATPLTVPSYFDLESDDGTLRIQTLIPSGNQTIPPGETIAFYCQMDETLWQKSNRLTMFDAENNRYSIKTGTG